MQTIGEDEEMLDEDQNCRPEGRIFRGYMGLSYYLPAQLVLNHNTVFQFLQQMVQPKGKVHHAKLPEKALQRIKM